MAITNKRKATNTDEDVDKEEPYPLLVKMQACAVIRELGTEVLHETEGRDIT